ncbi:MAG TPA: cupin domain-containing protein [Ramlibacter sp.]|uniref:cupin domain-containing protein n=1 Tax=Ramlibacter sp. TaxID=1917967 RepID=UPI002D7ECE08|nr:cupin domain-containing protein [Ramlibacter sp.]HET8748034.1 cupin domain-containing protein [Ramlibacter sp.]
MSTIDLVPAPQPFSEFEAAERARGCTEVLARSYEPETLIPEHTHEFTARALVIQGEMWLTQNGTTQHLKPGDRFEVLRGTPHVEKYGPQGATYWVARSE